MNTNLKFPPSISATPNSLLAGQIIHAVALAHGFGLNLMFSRRGQEELSLIRALAMYLIVKRCHLSTSAAGRVFRRDHGTISHALKRIQRRIDSEPEFKAAIDQWLAFDYSEVPEIELPKKPHQLAVLKTPNRAAA